MHNNTPSLLGLLTSFFHVPFFVFTFVVTNHSRFFFFAFSFLIAGRRTGEWQPPTSFLHASDDAPNVLFILHLAIYRNGTWGQICKFGPFNIFFLCLCW
jgi:hypothetical protein